MPVDTVVWKSGRLKIIDQTLLPETVKYVRLDTVDAVWEAIKMLRVRGAPAIGVCAAFGVLSGYGGYVRGPANLSRTEYMKSRIIWPGRGRQPSTFSGRLTGCGRLPR